MFNARKTLGKPRFALSPLMLLAVSMLTAHSAWGVNCPGSISGTYGASADISQTSGVSDCLSLSGSGYTVNLNGHSIICNNAGGCTNAIFNSASNVTVKNGYIVSGTGAWTIGIYNNAGNSLTVTNVTIDGAETGVLYPGTKVQNCVLRNIQVHCIYSGTTRIPAGGDIFQNYCTSANYGFLLYGPSGAASPATVRRNYVRGGIDTSAGGYVDVEQNIIDGGSITGSATTTTSKNLCDDATDCPDPDSNFTLSVDFTP